jgi:hypothetical protein
MKFLFEAFTKIDCPQNIFKNGKKKSNNFLSHCFLLPDGMIIN